MKIVGEYTGMGRIIQDPQVSEHVHGSGDEGYEDDGAMKR